MGGLHSAGRSRAHSQPRTKCVFVCLVASKSVTPFRVLKGEWGLPDGRHPERHKETAQHSAHWGCPQMETCKSQPWAELGNTDKVRPQLPRLSEKLRNQDDSLDPSHLRLHKSGGNGKPRADLGAGHRAVETQID